MNSMCDGGFGKKWKPYNPYRIQMKSLPLTEGVVSLHLLTMVPPSSLLWVFVASGNINTVVWRAFLQYKHTINNKHFTIFYSQTACTLQSQYWALVHNHLIKSADPFHA